MSLNKINSSAALLAQQGPRAFANRVRYRLTETLAEKLLGVDTAGHLTKNELGIAEPDAHEYSTVPYAAVFQLIRCGSVQCETSTFIDYGAGKGRALVAAATFPFRRVIGIELSSNLAAAARQNLARMRRRKALSVDVLTMDAALFEVPPDADLLFFYNPFSGQLLERVVANIGRSIEQCPRPLSILYVNDDHFQIIAKRQSWLERTREFQFYPNLRCGVYHSK